MAKHIRTLLVLAVLLLPACTLLKQPGKYDGLPSVEMCWQQTPARFGLTEVSMTTVLNNDIETYKRLVEESLMHRETAIDVMNRLRREGKLDDGIALSGFDLDRLNEGLMDHLALRSKLYDVAIAQSCWHKPSRKTYRKLAMQPMTEANQLKGTMLSLSAALILYDNYLMMSSLFEESNKLRRFLNQEDPAYAKGEGALQELAASYNSREKRRLVKRAIDFYEKRLKHLSPELFRDENFAYLHALIKQSQSYNMLEDDSALGDIGKHLSFMSTVTQDDIAGLRSEGVNLFSGLFGNAMGLVESRKGKLYDNAEVFNQVSVQLHAGDILLEKTPFRLTDKLIPGHWGHAAIWIGTETELKAMGIWNDPAIVPHHQKIREGASVVEALRSGVQMNSLQHFLNVDDIALLRSPDSGREIRIKRILLAIKQIGKDYDFNFDVETTDKIVCSELIYTVYTDMTWPTEKALGRYTISPDNVARKAVLDGSLELISLYHDGKEIRTGKLKFMAGLMGEQAPALHGWNRFKPGYRASNAS